MDEARFKQLLEQYVAGQISPEERKEFLLLTEQEDYRALLENTMKQEWESGAYEETGNEHIADAIEGYVMNKIHTPIPAPRKIPAFIMTRWKAAAAILILLAGGIGYYLVTSSEIQKEVVQTIIKNDVQPGSDKAILTLGNGSQITLDSSANGTLTQQGGARIVKTDSGRLAYTNLKAKKAAAVYNTLSTPRGGKYQLTLADGTHAWLNAASSISFPTAFTGAERVVSITGEVYFEVASLISKGGHKKMPFKVKVNGMEVSVLGTHFNINAYADETTIKTTLLEGSILTTKGNNKQLLLPGEQAQLSQDDNFNLVTNVDTDLEMAWKNNEFNFKYTDLKTVMRQLARWYDLDVIYADKAPVNKRFDGEIPMDAMLSHVLKALEQTDIHFRLEGKKLTVLP